MSAPITTYFRVCDGVRVRFADNKADSDTTVLVAPLVGYRATSVRRTSATAIDTFAPVGLRGARELTPTYGFRSFG